MRSHWQEGQRGPAILHVHLQSPGERSKSLQSSRSFKDFVKTYEKYTTIDFHEN